MTTTSGQADRTGSPRLSTLGSSLLLLAAAPLIVFHAGLLLERAMHRETLDTLVALRWTLSLAVLALLRSRALRLRALDGRTLAIVLLLVVTMIHAPVGVPEPAVPMAAAGLGLALALMVLDAQDGVRAPDLHVGFGGFPTFTKGNGAETRRAVKGRAPPTSR